MAKPGQMRAPVDEPAVVDPITRLVHREKDIFSQPNANGFAGVQLTNAIGESKGNRIPQGSPLADSRFNPVTPFVIKR